MNNTNHQPQQQNFSFTDIHENLPLSIIPDFYWNSNPINSIMIKYIQQMLQRYMHIKNWKWSKDPEKNCRFNVYKPIYSLRKIKRINRNFKRHRDQIQCWLNEIVITINKENGNNKLNLKHIYIMLEILLFYSTIDEGDSQIVSPQFNLIKYIGQDFKFEEEEKEEKDDDNNEIKIKCYSYKCIRPAINDLFCSKHQQMKEQFYYKYKHELSLVELMFESYASRLCFYVYERLWHILCADIIYNNRHYIDLNHWRYHYDQQQSFTEKFDEIMVMLPLKVNEKNRNKLVIDSNKYCKNFPFYWNYTPPFSQKFVENLVLNKLATSTRKLLRQWIKYNQPLDKYEQQPMDFCFNCCWETIYDLNEIDPKYAWCVQYLDNTALCYQPSHETKHEWQWCIFRNYNYLANKIDDPLTKQIFYLLPESLAHFKKGGTWLHDVYVKYSEGTDEQQKIYMQKNEQEMYDKHEKQEIADNEQRHTTEMVELSFWRDENFIEESMNENININEDDKSIEYIFNLSSSIKYKKQFALEIQLTECYPSRETPLWRLKFYPQWCHANLTLTKKFNQQVLTEWIKQNKKEQQQQATDNFIIILINLFRNTCFNYNDNIKCKNTLTFHFHSLNQTLIANICSFLNQQDIKTISCISTIMYLNISSYRYNIIDVTLSPFGEIMCNNFWKKCCGDDSNWQQITQTELQQFYKELYHNYEKTHIGIKGRAKYLIQRFGYYNEEKGKYFITTLQWKTLFTYLTFWDNKRTWTDVCLFDSTNGDPYSSIHARRLHDKNNTVNIPTADGLDCEINHLRLWAIRGTSNKTEKGRYQDDDDEMPIFLCHLCWKNHFETKMKSERSIYWIIYNIILEGLWSCDKKIIHDNAKQLFKHLQHFISNDPHFDIQTIIH